MTTEILTDEIETDDDAPDMTECDHCGEETSQAQYDASGNGLCSECASTTFVCVDCEGRTHETDAHATHNDRCEACGDSHAEELHQERLDAAKEAAQEAFDAILDLDDLDVIRKAVAALKRLQPK
jgi:recombinational DNA repair protein (RecF pathway)